MIIKVAWHAGKSKWKNFKNLKKILLGIELEIKAMNLDIEKFTNIQIKKSNKALY